jgi:hypothetical protein
MIHGLVHTSMPVEAVSPANAIMREMLVEKRAWSWSLRN